MLKRSIFILLIVTPVYPDCLSNYEFFKLLSKKLNGNKSEIHNISEAEFFSQCLDLLPRSIRDDLDEKGYYSTFNSSDVPFNDLKFPTQTGKINLQECNFEFGKTEMNLKLTRIKNQFTLITPSHPRLLHSQLGQIQSAYINDFSKIYLNNEDIRIIDLKKGETVLVSNEFGKGKYILDEKNILKSGTALIYSGLSSQSENNPNANTFTTDIPEEMGSSGAYNSGMVKIFTLKK
jgi:anaerobic selenocysteine-containing dehydrogenase